MLKKVLMTSIILAGLAAAAATPSPISIKTTKKTADTDHDYARRSRIKSVSHSTKDQYYNVELNTMTRGLPDYVTVKWVVLVEDAHGRIMVGTKGEKETALVVNKTAEVQTDTFTLESETWQKKGFSRERDSTVRGVGIRVCDDDGKILAEKYDPPSAEKDLLGAFDGKKDQRRDR